METISNMAGVASKALWGEGQQNPNATDEPVSGKQGAGTKEEPFDKGNDENPIKTGEGDFAGSGTTAHGDPSSGQTPGQKQQGADRPSDAPGPRDTDAIKDQKESAEKTQGNQPKVPHTDEEREEAMKKGEFPHDPNDHSGEPLKMHDGSEKKDRSASVSQEGGNPHGKVMGTGEQYVKSSGLVADGGDFDATNPGAGAEATRLQEEKGVKKDKQIKADPTSSPADTPGKTSKMAKLKEKLHLGTGKKLS